MVFNICIYLTINLVFNFRLFKLILVNYLLIVSATFSEVKN